MSWPKPGDVPFQAKGDRNLTAIIDWAGLCTEESYATGFKAAADLIVDGVPTATGIDYPCHPDQYFFPVAYLYRHCLELQLKALLRAGSGILPVSKDLFREHNLHKLWNKARELIDVRWSGAPTKELDAAERVILEFQHLDPCGQQFRYPRSNDGKKFLANAPPAVNLKKLKEVVDGVYHFLSSCNSFEI
jgi:hypothetical protein